MVGCVGGDAKSRLFAGKLLPLARRQWGEEAADVRRQHLLRACSAPAQRGEEGSGWYHWCCTVMEQDRHDRVHLKAYVALPSDNHYFSDGKWESWHLSWGWRKTSG